MARDPRKTLVRMGQAAEAAPFNRRSAQALLADLASRQPMRTGPAVNITVTHRLAPRCEAPAPRRTRPSRSAVGWAAIAAGVIIGVLTGLATLQNDRPATVIATSVEAPPAASAFVVRPTPEAQVVAVAPVVETPTVAAMRAPASAPRRPAAREPRPKAQPPVLYANRDPAPALPGPPPPAVIDRQTPEPTELAMITPPAPAPARPRALVVVRQSGAEVLGAAPRAAGARVERGSADELRSLDAERMAAAVDARQAVRLP